MPAFVKEFVYKHDETFIMKVYIACSLICKPVERVLLGNLTLEFQFYLLTYKSI